MRVHATINETPVRYEKVEGSSLTVPGQAVTAAELFRRQSLGLPMGVGVHGVTNIPEGMSYEQARSEALYYVQREAARKAAAQQQPPVGDPPPVHES